MAEEGVRERGARCGNQKQSKRDALTGADNVVQMHKRDKAVAQNVEREVSAIAVFREELEDVFESKVRDEEEGKRAQRPVAGTKITRLGSEGVSTR